MIYAFRIHNYLMYLKKSLLLIILLILLSCGRPEYGGGAAWDIIFFMFYLFCCIILYPIGKLYEKALDIKDVFIRRITLASIIIFGLFYLLDWMPSFLAYILK